MLPVLLLKPDKGLSKSRSSGKKEKNIGKNVKDAGENSIDAVPNAEQLNMSKTVQNHMNDIIKTGPNAGQLSRPYIASDGTSLLLGEIMNSGNPVQDKTVSTALKWNANGAFRGTDDIWELVVDTAKNKILHFNFVTKK